MGEIDALIKDRPNSPYFWELKGHVYAREGKHRDAVPALRKALQLRGNRSQLVRLELARSLVGLNDPAQLDEAIRMLEVALDTRPDDAGGHQILAQAYGAKNRVGDADAAMAQAHLSRGDCKQALIFAQRAQRTLSSGSRGWIKADDIIRTTYEGMPGPVRWLAKMCCHYRRLLAYSNEPHRTRAGGDANRPSGRARS